ncbi:protein-tyrosine phosphatase-like protein, partial [Sphaerosporella brunnea]
MSEIVPGLWLGNLECAQHYEWLANEGITHVLSLTSERVTIPVWTGIVHKQFRVRDNRRQNLLAQLIDGMQFLEEAFTGDRPVRVYVHCRMGISRSGSVVVGYLVMKYHSRPYKDALAFVRTKRVIVCPNKAFVSQLELLESCAFD